MEVRPSNLGLHVYYLNPSNLTEFVTADLAAIDTALTSHQTVSPFAYTATVSNDQDSVNIDFDDAGAALAAGMRAAFGLFLSPEDDKGNLIFTVDGMSSVYYGGSTTPLPNWAWIFGRKATNNTVVSDRSSVNNTLDKWRILPVINRTSSGSIITDSCNLNIVTKAVSGYNYFFGMIIDNMSGANNLNLRGRISMAFRKYGSTYSAFSPNGGV